MKDWFLDELLERFDCYTKIKTEQLRNISDKDYKKLLLETANVLFSEGRYSMRTECTLEMYVQPEAEESLNDTMQIELLTDDERLRLGFYKDLKVFCFPLFRELPFNLSAAPFNFNDGQFSIKNQELVDFLFHTPYQNLGMMICNALINIYWRDEDFYDSVVKNELSQTFFRQCRNGVGFPEEAYKQLVSDLISTNNHLEVGKQLGLSPMAQAIYDMTDTFICREYNYRQVDFAKDLEKWIEENWDITNRYPSDEEVKELQNEINRLANVYNISFVSKASTLNCIFLDLLGCSPFPPKEQEKDFDGFFDLPDE